MRRLPDGSAGDAPGDWRSLRPDCTALWVEVGCGKGKFTAETAQSQPRRAAHRRGALPGGHGGGHGEGQRYGAEERVLHRYGRGQNEEIFAPGEIDRLFINFPDPWPRKKNAKRRLTHRTFLDKYRRTCPGGGGGYSTSRPVATAPLFAYSLEEFAACGLEVKNVTHDLHRDGIVGIMTGYEEKFHALGTPINRCEIVCKTLCPPPGRRRSRQEGTGRRRDPFFPQEEPL